MILEGFKEEKFTKENKYYCEVCKIYTEDASKVSKIQ